MRRIPLSVRLAGAAIGLIGFLAFSWLLMPRSVELMVQLPSDAAPVTSLDLRVIELEGGADAYRGRRTRPEPGRSMLFEVKLSQGRYRVTATAPAGQAYEAVFDHDRDAFVEVALRSR